MLTPSGRFATDTKICLSISSFHPESWQPSWSVRSALIALIAFMQTSGDGAIGSIEVSPEIRRQMAIEARITPPKHANAERQELIKRMHAQMLDMEDRSRAIHKADAGDLVGSEMVELNEEQGEPTAKPNRDISKDSASSSDGTAMEAPKEGEGVQDPEPVIPEPVPAAVPTPQNDAPSTTNPPHQRGVANENWNWEDRGLAYLAMVLLLLLLALVARRIFLAFNSQPRFASHSWSSTGIDFRDVGDL